MKIDNRVLRHPFFPPILIGTVSMLGICLIMAFAWIPRPSPVVIPTRTVTPFKYLLLATETALPSSLPSTITPTEILSTPTLPLRDSTTVPLVQADQTSLTTDGVLLPPSTNTNDSKFLGTALMTAGTYDAGDVQLIRKGSWKIQDDEGAFQGSLLVSTQAGNSVTFRFDGYRIAIGYQGTDMTGELTVEIDGSEETFAQEAGMEWFSPELEPGTHFVTISHETGNTVNLDYVVIIE